jgi:dihydrofolate synthase/folylpolyglutamate synthase
MNYQQTIDYLYNKLPMFSRIGSAAFKKDLTNILILCRHLGNPQNSFKSIHVGGTNGKGSTSHMLAAIFQKAGYQTGLYTSPHLYDFRERIKLNGQMIEQSFVIDFVQHIKPVIEKIKPSFFEITVALAFHYFQQKKAEIVITEVGLGGRLDSTNIIMPELSVITNIGRDHMNMLGNSLQEIAEEKAGIIKKNTSVIIGERQAETESIFIKKAKESDAPVSFASDRFVVKNTMQEERIMKVTIHDKKEIADDVYSLDLIGIYQTKNLCTVLQAVSLLQNKFKIGKQTIKTALADVKGLTGLYGRWDVIHEQPKIVLDVAHNEPGINELLNQLKNEVYDRLHIIIGMVKDKECAGILKLLPADACYYFTEAHIPRALSARKLQENAALFSLQGERFSDVNEALANAKIKAGANDMILVCGSIFLIAEVDKDKIIKA